MSPRVAGAALALLAAVLLVASIVGVPAGWWTGHPLRNGEAMHKKDVDVTLLSAIGCNTGGDGSCEPLPMSGGFTAVRYVELGTSGLLVLLVLVLGGATLTASERRKQLAKGVIAVAIVSVGVAIVLVVMPKMTVANISLPVGPGLFVFFGAIACALLGSVLAMRPTPKLELQPPRQPFAPSLAAPPAAQPVDVLALLHDDPRAAPVDPMRPPPSPGGQLAGPAGPLGPPGVGAMPAPYPTMPTPAAFAAAAPPYPTMPAPPAFPAPAQPFPPPPAPFSVRPGSVPLATPPPPDPRPRAASAAPPPSPPDRSKASSPMPAIPGAADRSRGSGPATAIPVPALPSSPSVPPPSAAARAKAASIPPPSAPPGARPKSPSVAPIPSTVAGLMPPAPRAKGATGLPPPRGKAPSVPPPAKKPTTVAAVVPPPAAVAPMVPAMLPLRAETDPAEQLDTVDREAMTIARDRSPAVSIGRPATDAAIGDSTDASVALPPVEESTDLAAQPIDPPRDSASDIQTSSQRKLTASELVSAVARESQSEIETIARERFSASELAVGDSTSPAVIAYARGRTAAEIAELGEAPTARSSAAPAKVPVSTAPESLPPPKTEAVASSGPTPACPQCEAPMAWVEEHLRFYCKSCRMYF